MAMIHNNVFFGMWFCIGLIFIAGGIIIGAIVSEVAIPQEFMKRLEFDYSDTEEDCDVEDMNFYFFNLTNVDNFIAGLERPNYQQVGPYNFTRRNCIFDKQANDTWQSYRRYWELPVIKNDSVGKADDILVNINPGYLGVINSVSKVAPQDPDYGLLVNSLSPFLGRFISTLGQDSFKYTVLSNGVPVAYNQIYTAAIPKLEVIVRAGFGASFVANQLATVGADNFFNNASSLYGVSNIVGVPLGFTEDSINLILYHPTLGWLSDTKTFSGLALFANNNTLSALFTSQYNISGPQYGALQGYASGFLVTTAANNFLGQAAITASAYQSFFAQWTNASLIPGGYGLNGVSPHVDYFEVGTVNSTTIIASGISLAAAQQLWNVSDSLSFMTVSGVQGWLSAPSNATIAGALIAHFGITPTQLGLIVNWILNWANIVAPQVVAQINAGCGNCGFTDISQLPYVQWGTAAVLSGGSVLAYNPLLYTTPEFAVVSSNNGFGLTFNVNRSIALLNGTYGFTKGSNVATFMGLLAAGSTTQVATMWGINAQEIQALAFYFDFLAKNWVLPTYQNQVFPINSGLVVGRTPLEWMYTAEDYLLEFLGQTNTNVGVLTDADEAPTKEIALTQNPRVKGVFHGGSKAELKDSLEIKLYKGNTSLVRYSPPVPLYGNIDGTQFVPGVSQDEDLYAFTSILSRTMTFEYRGKSVTKGIKTYRFDVSEKNWESQYENPNNAPLGQTYHGLQNVTAYKSIPSFYSRPNFFGVDPAIAYMSTGLNDSDIYYQTWSIDIEPESGITMQKRLPGQLSLQIIPSTYFYPNVVPGIYPIAWQDDSKVISDEDAKDFKRAVGGARIGANVAFCLGPAIGIFIIVVIIYLRKTTMRSENSFDKEKNTVEMKKVKKETPAKPTNESKEAIILPPKKEEESESGSSSSGSSSGSSSESE